jgi:hypothetical protein
MSCWEYYWRSQGYSPNLNDDKSLWATERAKLKKATIDDVVLIGSSRTYFDIQKKVWQQVTGRQPIQLASTGSSPLPVLHDIVENTRFNGTLIVGVTPGLFFSTTYPKAFPWQRPQSKVDYAKDMTYAQLLNFYLSIPLQQNLVFMSADEEEWADDIDLKSLLRRIHMGNRTGEKAPPPFYNFGDASFNRNMSMTKRASSDTAFAKTIIKVWNFFGQTSPPPDKESTTSYFLKDAKKFIDNGGNLVLVRFPSSGGNRIGENKVVPRQQYWDDLLTQINVKAYHFEDYKELKDFTCPEESHLSEADAKIFTSEIAKIMLRDGALTKPKTN